MIVFELGDWVVHVKSEEGRRWRSPPLRWRSAHELALAWRQAGGRAYLAERRFCS